MLTLLGIAMAVGATAELIGGNDDPSLAGKGRLHDPFIQEVTCGRTKYVCERNPSI